MYIVSHFGGDLMGLWPRGLKKSEIVIFWAFFNFFAPWCAISHKDYWDWLYFHEKVLKKCSTCSKIPRISPSPWFNVVPSLEKLRQAVVTRNEKAKWQPTLNKGGRGCESHNFCDWLCMLFDWAKIISPFKLPHTADISIKKLIITYEELYY